ncbi:xanthine dehydrogenase family protein molybdopterin-binding subunit [Actinomadura madurae]|nr:xanthine dehydrogenase family protein molybdopterin-binding subunit [Actinomadura madurae]MCP9952691.1 xanthine dehydrogenase family protein molybdopterin-binding subunit [Actinomadura madurae]MCP9969457.1 xanthine dehydrogenase family protein molybdopterin-binding subunit [Actinomadura madurae]MCP9981913.1 xanthine dehydrogenase family protein molybdopterin-binding subunit [Actinomadura madurae]MCQ0006563.1 xanthine dehydrogenase family protein molybdopterin-binding subunit [Actinomadura ma
MSQQPEVAVGRADKRVEGRLKVTGRATYAADHGPDHGIDGVAYAVMVDSSIGRGRITAIDTAAAEAEAGVLSVLSHRNAPTLPYEDNTDGSYNPPGVRLRVFQDDQVRFFGQPVAVVVARSLEIAQHAAHLIDVTYEAEQPSTDLSTAPADEPSTYARGEAEAALESAPIQLDLTYNMARNHHNPMEPHATIARWERGRLTVMDKTQWVGDGTQLELATVFGIPRTDVRVISPYVGGAFGSALRCWPHVTVAALAARETGRPVKLVMARRQLYFGTGFRPAYEYRLRLGAQRDGRLTATIHDIRAETSSYETFTEAVMTPGRVLYSTPNVQQAYRTVPLDVNTPTYMRGPGYVSAVHILETAMDEVAHRLGIDPIELRRRNEPDADPSSELPFSTRRLQECYTVGAREFGWNDRNPEPGSTQAGDWLVGTGMAAAVYNTARATARASIRLNVDGTALVQAATSDMGPGTYTSMTQVAADELGLSTDEVTFHLGDSDMPVTPPHGASTTMASVGSAVHDGARRVRRSAIELAVNDPASPLHGADPGDVVATRGRLHLQSDPRRNDSYRALLARNGRARLEATGRFAPPTEETRSAYTYGAVFAEVGVDQSLGMIRIRRMLGVYDAGRIINPRLAHSQAIGGMVGGIGTALLEHTATDHRDGRITNANLADYLVPVNADVRDLNAIFLEGRDDYADPISVKGLGEVVQIGIAPAIANAVFHATGRRIRELPITIETML